MRSPQTRAIEGGDFMCRYKVFVDGSCKPNPGAGVVSVVLFDGPRVVHKGVTSIGEATNNIAEYVALVQGVIEAKNRGWSQFEVYVDSAVVFNQLVGRYKVKSPELQRLYGLAQKALSLADVRIHLIPRVENLAHPDR